MNHCGWSSGLKVRSSSLEMEFAKKYLLLLTFGLPRTWEEEGGGGYFWHQEKCKARTYFQVLMRVARQTRKAQE